MDNRNRSLLCIPFLPVLRLHICPSSFIIEEDRVNVHETTFALYACAHSAS